MAGVVGASAIVFCVIYNQWTFLGLVLILLIFCIWEFVRIADLPKGLAIWSYIISVFICLVLFLVQAAFLDPKTYYLILPLTLVGLVAQLFQSNDRPLRSMSMYFLGMGYIALPLSLLSFLCFYPSGYFNWVFVFSLFVLNWGMDSGAYFFGSAFGKHKLFERVSPKKSIEGAIGGILVTLVVAYVLSIYFDDLSMLEWLTAGLVVSVTGLFGDLVESYMKRMSERKDSGSSIPGHGGFLDRFDSLFFSIPFYLALMKFLQ